jgi:hypothetical protein
VGMQGREQSCPAGAENENVGSDLTQVSYASEVAYELRESAHGRSSEMTTQPRREMARTPADDAGFLSVAS